MKSALGGIAVLLVALVLAGTALARSLLVAELEALATRYHENPARLDAVRDGLTRAAREEADPETRDRPRPCVLHLG